MISKKIDLREGNLVYGKWNKNQYVVKRLLGEGANGKVYLVQNRRTLYALKIGFDSIDLQSEVNVLKTLDQRIRKRSPYFIEVDDLVLNGVAHPFYVMKYVEGRQIHDFIRIKGADWFHLIGKNLLSKLVELHQAGWQFCDLKMENIIVSEYGEIELVDYGGVTPHGSSVKQFTEIYDRGYWRSGSRIADETYDLFSFAVMFIQLILPKNRLNHMLNVIPQNRNVSYLKEILGEDEKFKPFHPLLLQALDGKLHHSTEALKAWKLIQWKGQNISQTSQVSQARLIKIFFISFTVFVITAVFVMQSM